MKLSVPCTFAPGLVEQLSAFPPVAEVYGRIENGWIGGGRSSYTLRRASRETLAATVAECRERGIAFNYLLNAASLYGMEQSRQGQRRIRATLDALSALGIPWLTVSLPYLLRLVKLQYPQFRVKAGVFAQIDTPEKARRWEELGADALCISAIACNRDFTTLKAIRSAVSCDLQLIANAACIPSCVYEHTHMDLLSSSSHKNAPHGGFCLDYCFLQCSALRLRQPDYFIKSIWIRPEDLHIYEAIGYSWFKLVERSCPADLLLRRVAAYAGRSFDGNLWELVGPVAFTPDKRATPLRVKLRTLFAMARPWVARPQSLAAVAAYAGAVTSIDYSRETAPVYIDNKKLDGFLEGIRGRGCSPASCVDCDYCGEWRERSVTLDEPWRQGLLAEAAELDTGLLDGGHWK
ncbi:MAG: U32 family peptidase [Chitinispirillaceae bacterium]|nr:U32 family peptidase [Chitinispirillaceae bacterium]